MKLSFEIFSTLSPLDWRRSRIFVGSPLSQRHALLLCLLLAASFFFPPRFLAPRKKKRPLLGYRCLWSFFPPAGERTTAFVCTNAFLLPLLLLLSARKK